MSKKESGGTPGDPIVPSTIKLDIETAAGARKERVRFWNMLATFVPASGYVSPQGRTVNILDLACGACDEAPILNRYFGGGSFDGPLSKRVRFVGIDKNEEKIKEAAAMNDRPNFTFIPDSAADVSLYPEVPEVVDVVVIRHPHNSSNPAVWADIFRQGIARLTDGGIMISPSFSEKDHQRVVDLLQSLGCAIVVNERNPYSGRDLRQGESSDRYVVIAKKPQAEEAAKE